jgi:hypothetical protein
MQLVEKQDDLMAITLGYEDRTGHLPKLLRDVITRLRLDAGTKAPLSVAASHHGDLRRKQRYSVAMVVEESRLLQVCLFTTLHKNTNRLEYSKLLPDVVIIADEVDAQLKQQMLRYMLATAVEHQAGVSKFRPNLSSWTVKWGRRGARDFRSTHFAARAESQGRLARARIQCS